MSLEQDLLAQRIERVREIEKLGYAPYGHRFDASHQLPEITTRADEFTAESLEATRVEVKVCGRLQTIRRMGKAGFANLEQGGAKLQIYIKKDDVTEAEYELYKGLDLGDIIGCEGFLFRTRTGELSIHIKTLTFLAKTLLAMPEKFHGLEDMETRYRQRYLDLLSNPEVRETFIKRAKIVSSLRRQLDAKGFVEVETPMLQSQYGGAAARPFVTHHNALDARMYLRIAPELYLKRLIVGGFERVYEINRNFRNEGLSTQHNPEFTMLELYWAYSDYRELMELIERLLHGLADSLLGTRLVNYQGRAYDLAKPFRRVTVEELILEHNPQLERSQLRAVPYLRAVCERLGVPVKSGDGAGKLQIEIFEKTAEHTLLDPTFVCAYPAEVSPLSRANDTDRFLTDRFEFFLAGRELANGFSELNDSEDQAARFRAQVARHEAGDDEAMHYDADYIRALEYGMPPTAGLGLGVDRLVMFLTDSASIRDVLLFPQMRPES